MVVLHKKQSVFERLHGGFARVQKGIEVTSRGFARAQKGLEVGSSRFCVISLTTQNCRGVSHTPSHGRRYTADDGDVFAAIVSFSPTSGRMRYAPTPVR